jgi:hypothetical protein
MVTSQDPLEILKSTTTPRPLPDLYNILSCFITVNIKKFGSMCILHTIKRRTANWIGHMLCRNCLLKHDR